MKGTPISFYGDRDTVDAVRRLGGNISSICRDALYEWLKTRAGVRNADAVAIDEQIAEYTIKLKALQEVKGTIGPYADMLDCLPERFQDPKYRADHPGRFLDWIRARRQDFGIKGDSPKKIARNLEKLMKGGV